MRFRTIWILWKKSPTDRLGKKWEQPAPKCLVNLYLCSEAVTTTLLCTQKVLLQALFRREELLQWIWVWIWLMPTGISPLVLIQQPPMIREILVQFLALPEGIQNPHFSPQRKGSATIIKMQNGLGRRNLMHSLSFQNTEEFQVQWGGQSEGIWFLPQTVKTWSGFTCVLLFVSSVL